LTSKDRRDKSNNQDNQRAEKPESHKDEHHIEVHHGHEEIGHEEVNPIIAIIIAMLTILGLLGIAYALKKAHEAIHHEHH
jgi:hypothetical protein